MEITAFISVCQCLRPVEQAAIIPVIPLVHITKTGHKLKTVLTFSQLADAALRIGIVELVNTLLIIEFPVQFILRMLARFAFCHLFILHFVSKQRAFLIFMYFHENQIRQSPSHSQSQM